MLAQHLLLLVVVLSFAAGDAANDAKKLQGTWDVISFEGGSVKKEELKGMKVVFKDDIMTLQVGDRKEGGTFKLDPSKKPKALDLAAGKDKEPALFIYELKGDDLKLCFRKPAGARPTEFTVTGADGLIILKRSK